MQLCGALGPVGGNGDSVAGVKYFPHSKFLSEDWSGEVALPAESVGYGELGERAATANSIFDCSGFGHRVGTIAANPRHPVQGVAVALEYQGANRHIRFGGVASVAHESRLP